MKKVCMLICIFYSLLMMREIQAHASVVISEVAWMGTSESANAEWIEFYNTSDDVIDLTGWRLYESGGDTLIFTFSKNIPGKTYFVLERVTPSVPDALPSINDESGSFGGSGLSNNGEHLVLKDSSGSVVAELNAGSGWQAGDVESKQTMQLSNGTWITAEGTPKASPSTGTVGGSVEAPKPKSSGNASSVIQKPKPTSLSFVLPEIVFRGKEAAFGVKTVIDGTDYLYGYYFWNMGDGTTYASERLQKIQHTYAHAGEYSVTFSFAYTMYSEPLLMETFTVSVIEPNIKVGIVESNGINTLVIENKNKNILDVSYWKAINGQTTYVFPRYSRITPGAVIRVASTQGAPFIKSFPISLYTDKNVLMWTSVSYPVVKNTIAKNSITGTVTKTAPLFEEDTKENISSSSLKEALVANAEGTLPQKNNKRTVTIVIGALIATVIGLFLLLDRFMVQKE